MYLQSLEILGFKSFAAKTVLTFHPGVTVIVGPNGCGKSNVLDSIRWVLGEQSAKALRGGEMADVIFSGTDSRPALGMAEVSMTFADCEKDLGVAWNEVTITRRVFRDGQGEYLLNKTPCRLRDITQLFMDTGVGRSAYSIMEQGKIDQILSSRPEERRAIFEEAAGITRFKSQRKEALRKLEATEANLLRLTDVIREVKRQIGSLQRQAAKARRYQALLADVRVMDTHNSRRQFDELEAQRRTVAEDSARLNATREMRERDVQEQESTLAGQRLELEIMEEKLTEARQSVNELKNRIVQGESRIGFNNERVAEFQGLAERYAAEVAASEEKIALQQSQIENSGLELESLKESLAAQEAELAERQGAAGEIIAERSETDRQCQTVFAQIIRTEERLAGLRGEIAACVNTRDGSQARMAVMGEEIAALENASGALEARQREMTAQAEQGQQQIAERKTEVEEAGIVLRNTQAELSQLDKTIHTESRRLQEKESKLEVLRQLNADGEGFSQGTQAVLKGLDNPALFKPAVLGALAQFIEVEPAFITPIETALGQNLQAIVMKDSMVAEAVVKTLVSKKLGRASLALRQIWASPEQEPAPALPASELPEGALGWAIDKVKAQPGVELLIHRLLDGTALVDNLETALRLALARSSSSSAPAVTFVTLAGELVSREGIVQGGASKESAGSSVLRRKSEIAALQTEAKTIGDALAAMTLQRNDAAGRQESAQQRLQEARDELQTLTLTLSHLRGQLVAGEREIHEARRKGETFGADRDAIERRLDEAVSRLGKLEEDAAAATAEISNLKAQQSGLQETLAGLRERESMFTGQLNEMRVRVATAKQRFSSLQNERQPMHARLAELREMIEHRRRDIAAYAVKEAQLAEDSENLQAGINQARGRLGEAEQRVEALLAGRSAAAAQVETRENALRQTRRDLSQCQERRTELEVRAAQIQSRTEHLCEHVQRRYQVDIRQFEPDSYALQTTVREQRKRRKSGDGAEESPEPARGEASGDSGPDVPVASSNPPVEDWRFIESVLQELEQKLEAMGPVNVEAIQEYDELEDRHKFLERQNSDLESSKAELLEVISKINATTKTLFSDTFEQIRINFQEMFTELFGGGKANLLLQDESDPLESGIDIIAKPPGKQLQSITLLSGGEKTMTAVSLLFAIYMVKPSPFCVLDEMDAPLDESNINRFIKILDRFCAQSQFVVISHNKRTIAKAGIIYGVTMEEHGVSKLVGVKFTKREESALGQDVMGTENTVPSVAESFGKHGDLHSERMETAPAPL